MVTREAEFVLVPSSSTVPVLIVLPPEKALLLLVRINRPAPFLISEPEPLNCPLTVESAVTFRVTGPAKLACSQTGELARVRVRPPVPALLQFFAPKGALKLSWPPLTVRISSAALAPPPNEPVP